MDLPGFDFQHAQGGSQPLVIPTAGILMHSSDVQAGAAGMHMIHIHTCPWQLTLTTTFIHSALYLDHDGERSQSRESCFSASLSNLGDASSLCSCFTTVNQDKTDLLMCMWSPKMKMPGLLFCNVSKTVSIKCKQKKEEVLAEQEKWCTLDDLIDLNIVHGI